MRPLSDEIICSECGTSNAKDAIVCTGCKRNLCASDSTEKAANSSLKKWCWAVSSVVVIGTVVLVCQLSSRPKDLPFVIRCKEGGTLILTNITGPLREEGEAVAPGKYVLRGRIEKGRDYFIGFAGGATFFENPVEMPEIDEKEQLPRWESSKEFELIFTVRKFTPRKHTNNFDDFYLLSASTVEKPLIQKVEMIQISEWTNDWGRAKKGDLIVFEQLKYEWARFQPQSGGRHWTVVALGTTNKFE